MRSGKNQFTAPWTVEEEQRLRSLYPTLFKQEQGDLFPGRNWKGIVEHAKVLRIRRLGRVVRSPRIFSDLRDGGYVTGLTDGEGWFMVSVRHLHARTHYNPKFGIGLRLDDHAILEWLQKYFDCGTVTTNRNRCGAAAPTAIFCVSNMYDLMRSVIPHFEAFPLRAKKRNDYTIWKRLCLCVANSLRRKGGDTSHADMAAIYAELRGCRKYVETEIGAA